MEQNKRVKHGIAGTYSQSPILEIVCSHALSYSISTGGAPNLNQTLPETKDAILTYGAQVLVWYILTYIFRNGATFTQIKHMCELVVKAPISNSTIGDTLRRMIKKRIIVEKHPGVYASNARISMFS